MSSMALRDLLLLPETRCLITTVGVLVTVLLNFFLARTPENAVQLKTVCPSLLCPMGSSPNTPVEMLPLLDQSTCHYYSPLLRYVFALPCKLHGLQLQASQTASPLLEPATTSNSSERLLYTSSAHATDASEKRRVCNSGAQ